MYNQSWVDTYANIQPGVTNKYLEDVTRKRLDGDGYERQLAVLYESETDPDRFYRIARDEKRSIVGMIDGKRTNDGCELVRLYVDKDSHGKGVAQTLWQTFLDWVGPNQDITLSVVVGNDRAKAFYKKCGFEEVPGTIRVYENGVMKVVDMIRKGDTQ